MVFSNKYPDLKRLTKDRWLVLHPNNDGLKDFTAGLRKMKEQNGEALRNHMEQEYDEWDM